jgi:hypothetical protein
MRGKISLAGTVALFFFLTSPVATGESWELRPAEGGVPGSAEIEAGRVDDAIQILTSKLDAGVTSIDLTILDNLCVSHALKLEYDVAMRYCNAAMGNSSGRARALNNRGVLRAVMGDRRGAMLDFRRASCLRDCERDDFCNEDSLHATVLRNLARLKNRDDSPQYVATMFWPRG